MNADYKPAPQPKDWHELLPPEAKAAYKDQLALADQSSAVIESSYRRSADAKADAVPLAVQLRTLQDNPKATQDMVADAEAAYNAAKALPAQIIAEGQVSAATFANIAYALHNFKSPFRLGTFDIVSDGVEVTAINGMSPLEMMDFESSNAKSYDKERLHVKAGFDDPDNAVARAHAAIGTWFKGPSYESWVRYTGDGNNFGSIDFPLTYIAGAGVQRDLASVAGYAVQELLKEDATRKIRKIYEDVDPARIMTREERRDRLAELKTECESALRRAAAWYRECRRQKIAAPIPVADVPTLLGIRFVRKPAK
jgi:hypothetical protein